MMIETVRTIERTLTIASPRSEVFKALMDPGALSRWLFATVTMTPQAGSPFSFEWRDSAVPATARGEILELVPDTRLVLSWFMEADGITSTASFDLSDAEPGGTSLRFRHTGFPPAPDWEHRFRAVALEWDKVLLNLRFLLEEKGEGKHLFYFRVQTPLPAPPSRAFRAWITKTGLQAWMARDVSIVAEEEQELEGVTLDTGKPLTARFHRIAADSHLRMSWSEAGRKGLLGISIWPAEEGVILSLTLRSFVLAESERPAVQALWESRFRRLAEYLERLPLDRAPSGAGKITRSHVFEATPSRIWNALTEAGLMRRWFVDWTDFEPRPGAVYTFLWDGFGEERGRVREARPGEFIRYTWDIPNLGETTMVNLHLHPDPDRPGVCGMELEHSGFGEGPAWQPHRQALERGWTGALALLDFYFRQGAGRERRGFRLRRRLPISLDRAVTLMTTPEGLRSWLAEQALITFAPGGDFEATLSNGILYRGRVVAADPSGAAMLELDSPVPAVLRWEVAPDPRGTQVGVTYTGYTGLPEWLEERRREWAERLDAIGAAAPGS
jgi:uncharacterized protein YndB with AHSA1/START domain